MMVIWGAWIGIQGSGSDIGSSSSSSRSSGTDMEPSGYSQRASWYSAVAVVAVVAAAAVVVVARADTLQTARATLQYNVHCTITCYPPIQLANIFSLSSSKLVYFRLLVQLGNILKLQLSGSGKLRCQNWSRVDMSLKILHFSYEFGDFTLVL